MTSVSVYTIKIISRLYEDYIMIISLKSVKSRHHWGMGPNGGHVAVTPVPDNRPNISRERNIIWNMSCSFTYIMSPLRQTTGQIYWEWETYSDEIYIVELILVTVKQPAKYIKERHILYIYKDNLIIFEYSDSPQLHGIFLTLKSLQTLISWQY